MSSAEALSFKLDFKKITFVFLNYSNYFSDIIKR